VLINLCAGLKKIGVPYRINDYSRMKRNMNEIAGVIGKPHVLDKFQWRNPIIFGAATFSHPVEYPRFSHSYPTVVKILVPGEWMRQMWLPYFGDKVITWPVGIDTDRWQPSAASAKIYDFLLYDKVLWNRPQKERELINPIRQVLHKRMLSFRELRYGSYREEDYHHLLGQCRAMIFLCEHETQGLAYQQALSAGVPILAWDGRGFWEDPTFYPHKVKYQPVSSVPYWDDRCGIKFHRIDEFEFRVDQFLNGLSAEKFAPRNFVLDTLTLERCASRYLQIWHDVANSIR